MTLTHIETFKILSSSKAPACPKAPLVLHGGHGSLLAPINLWWAPGRPPGEQWKVTWDNRGQRSTTHVMWLAQATRVARVQGTMPPVGTIPRRCARGTSGARLHSRLCIASLSSRWLPLGCWRHLWLTTETSTEAESREIIRIEFGQRVGQRVRPHHGAKLFACLGPSSSRQAGPQTQKQQGSNRSSGEHHFISE